MSKSKGSYYERLARDLLYKKGAKLVVKAAGSLGPVDLVAFFDDRPVVVSVKAIHFRDRSHVYYILKAIRELKEVELPPYCEKQVLVHEPRIGFKFYKP